MISMAAISHPGKVPSSWKISRAFLASGIASAGESFMRKLWATTHSAQPWDFLSSRSSKMPRALFACCRESWILLRLPQAIARACKAFASPFLSPKSLYNDCASFAASCAAWKPVLSSSSNSDLFDWTSERMRQALASIFVSLICLRIFRASVIERSASSRALEPSSSAQASAQASSMAASPRRSSAIWNSLSSSFARMSPFLRSPLMMRVRTMMRSVSATPFADPAFRKSPSASSATFSALLRSSSSR
mmetsp:Transcript_3963/g.11589  ORF Transcript_3963/g.11589 Transcript_3963/m.11589 type:complete len:249 (+) Transcript_3963:1627-2373(+)